MRSWIRLLAVTTALAASVSTAGVASAQTKPKKGVIELAEVVIKGRIQKPVASLDVNRIQPSLTLAELNQPFLERVEQAVYREPF